MRLIKKHIGVTYDILELSDKEFSEIIRSLEYYGSRYLRGEHPLVVQLQELRRK